MTVAMLLVREDGLHSHYGQTWSCFHYLEVGFVHLCLSNKHQLKNRINDNLKKEETVHWISTNFEQNRRHILHLGSMEITAQVLSTKGIKTSSESKPG